MSRPGFGRTIGRRAQCHHQASTDDCRRGGNTMGRPFSRQSEVTRVHFSLAHPGNRAVFLAEARTKKEVRQFRELFDMVGQLAQVVPISHGVVMSYAVQVDDDASLFGKIEWLLKTQFTFSLVERNFSD